MSNVFDEAKEIIHGKNGWQDHFANVGKMIGDELEKNNV